MWTLLLSCTDDFVSGRVVVHNTVRSRSVLCKEIETKEEVCVDGCVVSCFYVSFSTLQSEYHQKSRL